MTSRRYEHATELRAIADQIDAMPVATHRLSAEAAIAAKVDLARSVRARADELVRTDEPPPDTVFLAGRGRAATGRPFSAEIRRAARAA